MSCCTRGREAHSSSIAEGGMHTHTAAGLDRGLRLILWPDAAGGNGRVDSVQAPGLWCGTSVDMLGCEHHTSQSCSPGPDKGRFVQQLEGRNETAARRK
eukprot:366232-Chlamydomonas_euryale.AAC.12